MPLAKGFTDLRQFLHTLRKEGEIVDVFHEVDPSLEIAEIHRRVAAAEGPALFFHKVKNSSYPVVTNLFGSLKRISLAFHNRPEVFVKEVIDFATQSFPPTLSTLWNKRGLLKGLLRIGCRKARFPKLMELENVDLDSLPLLKCWPLDGGHFITLPLVYTEAPPNLGMYRIQRYDKKRAGLHFQIAKGGGFHYHQAESQNRVLPVNIFIGGPPALMLGAITPLPENLSELLISSLLQGSKVSKTTSRYNDYPLLTECEFALIGYANPHERRPEGPFGDHYGYYSLTHDFPVFHCQSIFCRKGAIFPATVVGKPRQEDYYLGNYLQKLLSPLFPVVMPGVKALWSYGETGFHSLAAAIVKERYTREAMSAAFRILGEGQLALTKTLLITDQPINLENFKETLTTLLERFRPETDLYIFSNLSLDTLDYTGPKLNEGSRAIFLGIGDPIRPLKESYEGPLLLPFTKIRAFSPGCLVLEVAADFHDFEKLLSFQPFASWPLLILVDDLEKTLRSETSFLWTVFTRFEPASDIHANKSVIRNHLSYSLPILIDARLKPSYPPEVLPDEETSHLVTQNWNHYFPQGMAMGPSATAHVS